MARATTARASRVNCAWRPEYVIAGYFSMSSAMAVIAATPAGMASAYSGAKGGECRLRSGTTVLRLLAANQRL